MAKSIYIQLTNKIIYSLKFVPKLFFHSKTKSVSIETPFFGPDIIDLEHPFGPEPGYEAHDMN